jgi:hypothetical protein
MKFRKTIFIFAILFLSIRFSFAQRDFNENLLGSISPPWNCEYVLQHVDSLIEELEKNPASLGYIVIYRQQEKPEQFNQGGFYHEDLISLHLRSKRLNIDPNRIRIVRGESEKYKIDFLITQNKSGETSIKEAKWSLNIPSKPVLFDEGDGGQLCNETPFRLNTFAEILTAHPKARGHFVIYGASIKDFPKAKQSLVGDIEKVGIPLNRFKFFFKKDNSVIYPHVKLWLIPNGK